MSSSMIQSNLDRLAAQHAQEIIRRTCDKKPAEIDNTVTKALGILQENGVYACFLYLKAKQKNNGDIVVNEMLSLLDNLGFGWGKPSSDKVEDVLRYITDKVTDIDHLDRLLLVKEILEQMLIYTRYGAKARS